MSPFNEIRYKTAPGCFERNRWRLLRRKMKEWEKDNSLRRNLEWNPWDSLRKQLLSACGTFFLCSNSLQITDVLSQISGCVWKDNTCSLIRRCTATRSRSWITGQDEAGDRPKSRRRQIKAAKNARFECTHEANFGAPHLMRHLCFPIFTASVHTRAIRWIKRRFLKQRHTHVRQMFAGCSPILERIATAPVNWKRK